MSTYTLVGIAPISIIRTILFANLPQGVLSLLYLLYGRLFSYMLGAQE
jgi:hypothetical protein